MFDPITLAVGGGLALGGWLAGRFGRGSQSGNHTAPGTATVCSCGHGYGSHDGPCRAEIERPHYHSYGGRSGYEWVPCPCQAYDGPEPLPRVWATELEMPTVTPPTPKNRMSADVPEAADNEH